MKKADIHLRDWYELECSLSGDTDIIEAELFQYHKTVTPRDIILPEVVTIIKTIITIIL